jgi:crossover junction endodeoxyribonuclease RuvC
VRALGIDPGSRVTGWGVVERRGSEFHAVEWGTIRLPASLEIAARLARVYAACGELVAQWCPEAVVVERAFVGRNVHSALRLGETRGVVLAAASATGVQVSEYTPAEVKLAAVGHGRADKETVGRGVVALLRIARRPASDASDALALALCHLQQAPLREAVARALGAQPR